MIDASRDRFVATLLALFAIVFAILAIDPHDRRTWLLENVLVVGAIAVLAIHDRRFPLSRVSCGLVFVFLVLHEIGAHFTYERVPYAAWGARLSGADPGAPADGGRNHYDRFVHFAFGLLLAYPVRELHRRVAGAIGFWSYFLPLQAIMAAAMAYELFEWTGAALAGGSSGLSFVGAQGDPWDAQKDMAVATLGAAIAMLATLAGNRVLQPDFGREWNASVTIDHPQPLGETAIARMREQRARRMP